MSHRFFLAFLLLVSGLGAAVAAEPAIERIPGKGSYAVIVSRATYDDAQWRPVVDALREKHEAAVLQISDVGFRIVGLSICLRSHHE